MRTRGQALKAFPVRVMMHSIEIIRSECSGCPYHQGVDAVLEADPRSRILGSARSALATHIAPGRVRLSVESELSFFILRR